MEVLKMVKISIELSQEQLQALQGIGGYSKKYVVQDIIDNLEEAVEGMQLDNEDSEIEVEI
jgi:hypothetical protein